MKSTIAVKGMKCGGCEANLQNALLPLAGVVSAKASSKDSSLEIEYDENVLSAERINQVIVEKGFQLA
jgi:copper chaperone